MCIKSISDSLFSIGENVLMQEKLDVILEGLPIEFESLITLINSKSNWFDFDKIESLLLALEQRINKEKDVVEFVSLNIAQSTLT